ncbi:hypothetical protein SARC_08015 [Sphaeroforma arctica JP610]|uniref:DNA-directed RNA polymerase subunit n=1 Tax=Sphaeroforma arctica JP610 TaxID=667725 RepID=A0A0L0FSP3_9EUKA|nr:hypothetical protein SARC_08015 [Sphaeroforma arctica JP610]KNC79596.1 hypothetical protein SARC_08015 [Sphaeroforma arctica JP610]|eukprot:XP_014153498.1 hypothetical protein SARC_08015 [Sphaeroforma arctica JP610]
MAAHYSNVGREIKSVGFSLYSTEEVKKLSVVRITNPILLDHMQRPTLFGLYDKRMGPIERYEKCETCTLNIDNCPGHPGHIELPLPVYNPIFFVTMFQVLRSTCLYCHQLKESPIQVAVLRAQLRLLKHGLIKEAKDLEHRSELSNGGAARAFVGDMPPLDVGDIDLTTEETSVMSFIRKYVADARSANGVHPTDDNPKVTTTHAHDERRRLVKAFLQRCATMNACKSCRGISPSLRKDGASKVFRLPLATKNKRSMEAKKLKISIPKYDEEGNEIVDKEKVFEAEDSDVDSDDGDGNTVVPDKPVREDVQVYMSPVEVRSHIRKMWSLERRVMDLIFGSVRAGKGSSNKRVSTGDMFFLSAVPVPPSKFRPASRMGEKTYENGQNVFFGNILKHCVALNELSNAKGPDGKPVENSVNLVGYQSLWLSIQMEINGLMDMTVTSKRGDKDPPGIRQLLEKKEGLFRMHMMGKRVNFACRSVISPDPYIGTHEMGIPLVFALKLTFPEPVTAHNIADMREAVINGPEQHPGATHVEMEDGSITNLSALNSDKRLALGNMLLTPPESGLGVKNVNKKVWRHIRTGDWVLANRQPSLHKPSIMAHQARVLSGEKTLRMHYANCNTYNADFDGDEMNVHFPQSQFARAEAQLIANTDNQYLVPTSGKPLRGLIQDHVASGTVLTSRGTYLTKEQYQQLLYSAFPNVACRIETVPPCVVKPRQLWSGKQVITSLLKNICMKGRTDEQSLNLTSKSKVPGSMWGPHALDEDKLLIHRGELLRGVLDKSQFGATAYGLVHSCQELYGAEIAGKLLTAFGRLFTHFLQTRGLTCGLADLTLQPEADKRRLELLKQAQTAGVEEISKFVGLTPESDLTDIQEGLAKVYQSDAAMAGLDNAMKSRLNTLSSDVIATCLPDGAYKAFPHNNLSLMITSGAKGSPVNSSQISCLLGQQELEGRRVPVMVSGRSLPSFLAHDVSARSGGYVMGRFLTGIKPQEYYFHCMAGREGLVDTAVKTARSGYLQRCLIKHLEGLRLHYDLTVRDIDGGIVQFNYGEDGIDVTKVAYMKEFDFMAKNQNALLSKYDPVAASTVMNTSKAVKLTHKLHKAFKKDKNAIVDPVLSHLRPDKYLGSVSEQFEKDLSTYVAKQEDQQSAAMFRTLMFMKYKDALADPGEAVGLLAAQSVGEPSTQMTLNTFHFAGFGAMNVTLGIPRLREILMTASKNIKTPAMTLPLRPFDTYDKHVMRGTDLMATAKHLQLQLGRLVMSDVLSNIEVHDWVTNRQAGGETKQRYMMYKIRLEFNPEVIADMDTARVIEDIKFTMERRFVKMLVAMIDKHMKKVDANVTAAVKKAVVAQVDSDDVMDTNVGRTKAMTLGNQDEEEAYSDAENEEDMDATTARNNKKRTEASTYDDDDDDEGVETSDDEGDAHAGPLALLPDEVSDAESDSGPESMDRADRYDAQDVENFVRAQSGKVHAYRFAKNASWFEVTLKLPSTQRKLLLLSMLEVLVEDVVVRSTEGIKRCIVQNDDDKPHLPPKLQTEGANLKQMWEFSELTNINELYSNDVCQVLETYGVEAARQTIVNEIAGVFKVYGISVDLRHLSLIADYMTFEGGYKPFNRVGIESNTSPMAQMSFETTMHFMRSAIVSGATDTMESPSARLVMGRLVEGGTGCFDIRQPLSVSRPIVEDTDE